MRRMKRWMAEYLQEQEQVAREAEAVAARLRHEAWRNESRQMFPQEWEWELDFK